MQKESGALFSDKSFSRPFSRLFAKLSLGKAAFWKKASWERAEKAARALPAAAARDFFPEKPPKLSYRSLVFVATALTGFASLCAQTAWWKYLSVLVGSEIRSISLVTAVFLSGLAAGYYSFGRFLAGKQQSRRRLMKFYGWLEILTALYISSFHLYFGFLKALSFHSPPWLLADLLISVLALFAPTFLMGASLPVLTAVLPENSRELNRLHIRLYGYNTLGAFSGVLAAGFFFLPALGLDLTMILAGALNFAAGLVFVGNRLTGDVRKAARPPPCPSKAPDGFWTATAFVSGAVVIFLEILFVRLLNISAGAGVYNFPIILSLFVGGLASGSLSVNPLKISGAFFIRQILIAATWLAALFAVSPYWSIWIAHIRVSLFSLPSNYYVFKIILYLFLFAMIFPAVFFAGRLLPLAYALLKKTEGDGGARCGRLYFLNTLGTVAGAIGGGYLAFYILNLDDLFKTALWILAGTALIAAVCWEKKHVILSCLLCIGLFFLPEWDRTGHYLGYFRVRQPSGPLFFNKKLFHLPNFHKGEILYFNDGPNSSVALIGHKTEGTSDWARKLVPAGDYDSIAFVVNGKAIGRTLGGDFSTMFLLPSLGRMFAPERAEGLSSAVIGLGTGISAGVMGSLKDSREVTVLEIAPEVIDMVRRSPGFNFGVMSNSKVKILPQDGFKYFTRTRKKFDLILSEPSNPWIAGVENVFSLEFYELAKASLAEDGVLVQWAQLYSIDAESLRIMFRTIKAVFPHARLYQVGLADIVIAASPKPLNFQRERFFDPVLKPYFEAIGFQEPEDLSLVLTLPEDALTEAAFRGLPVTLPETAGRKTEARPATNDILADSGAGGPVPAADLPAEAFSSENLIEREGPVKDWAAEMFSTGAGARPATDGDATNPNPALQRRRGLRQGQRTPAAAPFYGLIHTLTAPKLAYRGDKTFFTGAGVKPEDLKPEYLTDPAPILQEKARALIKWRALKPEEILGKCAPEISFLCGRMNVFARNDKNYSDKTKSPSARFESYLYLRKRGFIDTDLAYLEELKKEMTEKKLKNPRFLFAYISHLAGKKLYREAEEGLSLFEEAGLLTNKEAAESLRRLIDAIRKKQDPA